MTTPLETEFARIDLDASLGCLVLHWKKNLLSLNGYQNTLLTALDIANQNQLKYWVANQKDMGMLSLKNEAWTLESWFPKLERSSVKLFILIESDDEFNRQVTSYLWEHPKASKTPIRFASSPYEALIWVKSQAIALQPA